MTPPVGDEPTATTSAAVTGECTAEIESIAPAGGQRDPALGATLVAKAARCMRGTPARYRFIAKSPNTGTSVVACDWQLGRTCRWNTASLAERGLWSVQLETSREGQPAIDGRSAVAMYAVGGVCRSAAVVSALPASETIEPGSSVAVMVSASCDAGVTPQYAVYAIDPTGASSQVGAWSTSPGPFAWSTSGLAQGRYKLEARVRQLGSIVAKEASATAAYTLGRYVCDAPQATATGTGATRAVTLSSANCTSGAVPFVRFTRRSPTGATQLLQDWGVATTHNWNVASLDGTWRVLVELRAQQTPTQAVASTTISRALGAACTAVPGAPLPGPFPDIRAAGDVVTMTASEVGCDPEFRFQMHTATSTAWQTVCDWTASTTCAWNTSGLASGTYAVQTLVRLRGSTDIAYESATAPVAVILDANDDGDGYSIAQGDCHDANASVHPGAGEVCNGLDDNCDGTVDEGVAGTYYVDADGDGYGDPNGSLSSCAAQSGFVSGATDCDDALASVHPGASEICGNAIDENCDGLAPISCSAVGHWYLMGNRQIYDIDTSTGSASILPATDWSEGPLIVGDFGNGSAIRTSGLTGGYEYLLDGTFTGLTSTLWVPNTIFVDAAYDGTNSYVVDVPTGDVYRAGKNYESPSLLFHASPSDAGITYDSGTNTLWLSNWTTGYVTQRSMSGQVLSVFSGGIGGGVGALAYDRRDGTLWYSDGTSFLKHVTRNGVLLGTIAVPGGDLTGSGEMMSP